MRANNMALKLYYYKYIIRYVVLIKIKQKGEIQSQVQCDYNKQFMKRKNKKGFTLVELLVVIAILAILAAVSVVGYLGFTNKAKQSSDEQIITQLNIMLQGDEALNGKPSNMSDVVVLAKENGFYVENISPKTEGTKFVWSQENNKFYIMNNENTIVYPETNTENIDLNKYWLVVDEYDKDLNFAQYLKDKDYSQNTILNDIKTSLDVGLNDEFTEINYLNQNAKTSFIRTNGGTLNIDAPNDTIMHYGSARIANIINVDPLNSYHGYADVSLVKVKNGHIIFDKELSSTPDVLIATEAGDIVNIETKIDLNVLAQNGAIVDDQTVSIVAKDDAVVSIDETISDVVTNGNVNSIEITKVSNEDELRRAIDEKKVYIQLTSDILDVKTKLVIEHNCVLNGAGYKIESSMDVVIEDPNTGDARFTLLTITNIKGGTVQLNNLTLNIPIINPEGKGRMRTLVVLNTTDLTLNINNSSISTEKYYALRLNLNENLTVNIENGVVSSGWSAIYNIGNDVKLTANNSSFIGKNPYHSGGNNNSFATIIVSEYYYLINGNNPSKDNTFIFNDCKIVAIKEDINSDVEQSVMDIRSPMNNKVYLNNTKVESNSVKYDICLYSNFDGVRSPKEYDGTSEIFEDGVKVTEKYYIDGNEDLN